MSRSVSHYSISAIFFPNLAALPPTSCQEKPGGSEGLKRGCRTALGFPPTHLVQSQPSAPYNWGVDVAASPPIFATKQPFGRNDGSHSGVKRSSEPPANEQVYSRRCKINGTLLTSAEVSMNRGPAACLWQMECAKYQRAVIQKTTSFDKF